MNATQFLSAQTGDISNAALYIGIAVVAVAVILLTIITSKKKK